jgi:hypothetical protein
VRLFGHKTSPQVMSFVLPLLVKEGFCTVSYRKRFVIHKRTLIE